MAPIISFAFEWVIIPMIMLAIFSFAWLIAGKARTPELRISAWAGFWAGLLAFVIYAISELGQIKDPTFRFTSVPGLMLMPLGCGLSAGFVFLGLVKLAEPTRLVGLITLALAGTSASAFFTYIFLESLRVSVLYWTMGASLGILLHIVLNPSSIEHLCLPTVGREGRGLIDTGRNDVNRLVSPVQERTARPDAISQPTDERNAAPRVASDGKATIGL
jgi:hypothetical protein